MDSETKKVWKIQEEKTLLRKILLFKEEITVTYYFLNFFNFKRDENAIWTFITYFLW